MTQLLYQKSLEALIEDLMSPEGYEFNLLNVDRDIPRASLTDKESVKALLLANGMIYVGTVDESHDVSFDADRFETARQVIVIAKGVR